MCYVLDVGGGEHPCGDVVLDIIPPINKLNNVEYVVGDACNLPFRSNSFSKVISYGSLNYFSDDIKFFREVSRVLRIEGFVVISVFTYYSFLINCIDLLKRDPIGAFKLIFNTIRRRYRWYTVKSLIDRLTYCGFKVIMSYRNVSFAWRPTTTPHNILVVAIPSSSTLKLDFLATLTNKL
jgi:ubiquinone/menaquinone biosynthesis C-methylase UbiE